MVSASADKCYQLQHVPHSQVISSSQVCDFFFLTIRIEQSFEAEATSVFPLLTAMSVISPWMAAKAKNNQQPLHQPGNTNNKL